MQSLSISNHHDTSLRELTQLGTVDIRERCFTHNRVRFRLTIVIIEHTGLDKDYLVSMNVVQMATGYVILQVVVDQGRRQRQLNRVINIHRLNVLSFK